MKHKATCALNDAYAEPFACDCAEPGDSVPGVSTAELVRAYAAAKRGPKPLHGENMQAFHFRMTKAQREKLDRLGGAAWLREKIDKAKAPALEAE